MITITIENEKYEMPSNWDELTLGKFMDCMQFKTDEDDYTEIIASLSGIPKETLMNIPYQEYLKIQNQIQFITQNIDDKPEYIFKIDDVEYGMNFDFANISTAEFLDIEYFTKDNPTENLHILCAIIYRPIIAKDNRRKFPSNYIIEKYKSEDVISRADLFKDKMKAKYAVSASVFFSLIGINCLTYIQDYSQPSKENQMKKTLTKRKKKKV